MRAGGAVAAPSMISNLATVSLSLNALGPLPVPAARHTADHPTQRRPASPAPAWRLHRSSRGRPRATARSEARSEGASQPAAGLSRRMMATSMFLIFIRTSRKKILPCTTSRKW